MNKLLPPAHETLEPGKYVVAVSGGVDSVVLLHMLYAHKKLDLVVAHFDHGIRDDSVDDALFVAGLALTYGLPFFTDRQELGVNASEATARTQRYLFLNKIKDQVTANAIVTAHHQDDVIETAILNMLRGTKRRGFVSLRSTAVLRRPLLSLSKQQILDYAVTNSLEWREDSTNNESKYIRNKLRKKIAPTLNIQKRQQIMALLHTVRVQSDEIDEIVLNFLQHQSPHALDKQVLLALEPEVAYEIVAAWLRLNRVTFDKTAIVRIINGARSLQNNAQIDVQGGWYCRVYKDKIVISRR